MRSLLLLLPMLAFAQASFEVATIKPTPPDRAGYVSISPWGTGRFTASSCPLRLLVEMAFGRSGDEIVGLPDWAEDRYDFAAKAPDGVVFTYERIRRPLQEFLAAQFNLATHAGKKEKQGYALVAAKGGPKLKPAAKPAGQPSILPNGLYAPGVPVDVLAAMLARAVRRPVIDETGISGIFHIALQYAPPNAAPDSPDAALPSVFTALQEQLGLKLESRKIPVDTLVIDRIERQPAGN